jgi:hypothetical protein
MRTCTQVPSTVDHADQRAKRLRGERGRHRFRIPPLDITMGRWSSASWTYNTVAAISGKKLSNLASIDVGVHIA